MVGCFWTTVFHVERGARLEQKNAPNAHQNRHKKRNRSAPQCATNAAQRPEAVYSSPSGAGFVAGSGGRTRRRSSSFSSSFIASRNSSGNGSVVGDSLIVMSRTRNVPASRARLSQTCRDLAFPLSIAWNAIAAPEGEASIETRDGMVRSAKKELTAIAQTTEPGSHLRVIVEATATATGALSPGDSATQDAFTDSVGAVVELCESNGEPLELTGWYGG